SVCDKALMALNSIKHNYSRSLARYSGPVSQKQLRARTYERRFWKSLESGEFVVWFQPKYDSCSEKIAGAEALVRWFVDGRMIPPGEFLDIFEEDGLISELDAYVFKQVCAQQRTWLEQGNQILPVSVNISRCSLFSNNVVDKYRSIITQYDIDPALVPIEITESAAINSQNIKPIADKFAQAGFVLHMDDFGSGNSSLNGLNILHFDVVKLDKSLIDFIGDKNGELILTYTIALGKELGLHLVAEGVENYNQLQFLKNNGCDEIQGYYFSKPLPLNEFEKKITGERNSDLRKRNGSDFKQEVIYSDIEHMPGGFFTYEKNGDERILSSNRYVWKMFGCETEDEFMKLTGGSFKGMVADDEYAKVRESIYRQIDGDSLKMDYVEYDIICKDGKRRRVVDFGRLNNYGKNDVFSVFIKEKN
ncbi:MAG: EAL domain-containing protein, partial [Erysipelotrichaceae bacterium]